MGLVSSVEQLESCASREQYSREAMQHLRVLFRAIQSHSKWVEKQCGVSAEQLWAMCELNAKQGLKVSELSSALSIHKSTASNMLDKLERKGLIKRERYIADQRVVRVYLTEQGRALVERAPIPAQGTVSDALARLPEATLAALTTHLGELIEEMSIPPQEAAVKQLSDS